MVLGSSSVTVYNKNRFIIEGSRLISDISELGDDLNGNDLEAFNF